jgi:hypothetical protein
VLDRNIVAIIPRAQSDERIEYQSINVQILAARARADLALIFALLIGPAS